MKALSPIMALLGGGSPKVPELPAAVIPAAPAPTRRTDTGASVSVGSDAVKNQRVSGKAAKTSSSTVDIMAGLGKGGGISI